MRSRQICIQWKLRQNRKGDLEMQIMTSTYQSKTMRKIHELLYELGVNAGSCAFFHTSYAIWLAIEQPERLQLITKWLYPEVAVQYGTNWRAIERSVRRIINRIWLTNPDLLRKIAHNRLYSRPTATEFIAILAAYISKQGR